MINFTGEMNSKATLLCSSKYTVVHHMALCGICSKKQPPGAHIWDDL